eukprot:IDg18846t1
MRHVALQQRRMQAACTGQRAAPELTGRWASGAGVKATTGRNAARNAETGSAPFLSSQLPLGDAGNHQIYKKQKLRLQQTVWHRSVIHPNNSLFDLYSSVALINPRSSDV